MFSLLSELESFRDPIHKDFTLRMYWPDKDMSAVWRQSSNPIKDDFVENFELLHTCCET